MAALVALLVILPATAAPGTVVSTVDPVTLTVSVLDNDDDIADTRVGNTLYASNDDAAFNEIRVTVVGNTDDAPITVVNTSNSNRPLVKARTNFADAATETDFASGESFSIVKEAPAAPANAGDPSGAYILARHGNTISVTVAGARVRITVDGEGPQISGLIPADGFTSRFNEATFSAVITDSDSGMRGDSGDGDRDNDGVSEPLTVSGTSGQSEDIDINIGTEVQFIAATTADDEGETARPAANSDVDRSSSANTGWETTTDGYVFRFARPNLVGAATNEVVYWNVAARDRVGNETFSDVGPGDPDKHNGKITIDRLPPLLTKVETGTGFDEDKGDKGAEVSDAKSLKLTFENANNDGSSSGEADSIDSSSVSESDFVLGGDDGESLEIDDIQVEGGYIYLTMTTKIPAAADVSVQMLAGVITDKAGSPNRQANIDADDGIGPTFTVGIAGVAGPRPVTNDEITITITADEDLNDNPVLYVFSLKHEAASDATALRTAADTADTAATTAEEALDENSDQQTRDDAAALRTTADEADAAADAAEVVTTRVDDFESVPVTGLSTWTAEFAADDVDGISSNSLVGVLVTQLDESTNRGTTGNVSVQIAATGAPAEDDLVDIADLAEDGLLFEFDESIDEDPTWALHPSEADEPDETQSRNPFLEITFSEGKELKLSDLDKIDEDTDDEVDVDSHSRIEIVTVEVDGVDAMDSLNRASNEKFTLSMSDLALGEHTVALTAVDDAGNETDTIEIEFERIARKNYEVELRRGWNLVSIPAHPADSAIDSVLPDDHAATTVLSYQNGEWVTAARDTETGGWAGTLTDIVAGYGYFISNDGFDALSTQIPEADPTTQLPVVPVTSGWNLLGVVDVGQGGEGTEVDADTYLASIEWTVAYGFNRNSGTWDKIIKNTDDNNMLNGSGYWVWATEAGTLVP